MAVLTIISVAPSSTSDVASARVAYPANHPAIATQADVSFDRNAPAGAFANKEFAHLFFKTTRCLRQDQTGCFKPGTQYYEITHTGLDAMVTRFIEEMTLFSKLPDDLAYTNATR